MSILSSRKIKWTLFSVVMVVVLAGVGLFIWVQTTTAVVSKRVNTDEFGVAILGYDTVAYHAEGRPVKGKSEFSYSWNDAVWHFASAENRDLFAADPERYAPRYGGY
jgi:YHS domain-containing protein